MLAVCIKKAPQRCFQKTNLSNCRNNTFKNINTIRITHLKSVFITRNLMAFRNYVKWSVCAVEDLGFEIST